MASNKELKAVIALAGRLDPSLAAAVKGAQAQINALDKKAKRTKAVAALGRVGKATAKAIAVGFGAATVATGAFVASSVKKGMEFDSAMSQVAATLGTTTDQIGDLRKFALKMGSTTAFTATQSAEALNYMALAGYDAETSMKMLPNVLNLAAAGNIELSEASDMVTDAQSALGLSIEETNTLVDQMAKTASKTNTSVGQLGEAILTVGGTAQYMAGGTAGVTAALGVLADNGIKASEGGTHLRNILLKLANPTSEATALLDKMGVQVFDTQGKLKDFSQIFPELNQAMSSMTDEEKLSALSTLFNARDIASATALLGTTKERWDEIATALGDCEGAAQAMAATQLDNLQGDVTLFKSALEGAQITLSDALTPALREFVQFGTQSITELQSAFTEGGLSGVITALVGIISQMLNALISALPQIIQAAFQLITELAAAIISALPQLIQVGMQIVLMLIQGLTSALPQLLVMAAQAVIQIAQGIVSALPQIIQAGLQLIMALAQAIAANYPALLAAGVQMVGQLLLGIVQALPQIITCAVQLVLMYVQTVIANVSQVMAAGIQVVIALIQGIISALPQIISAGIQGVFMLAQGLLSNIGTIIQAGVQLVIALGEAIITNLPSIIGGIVTGLGQGIVDGIGSIGKGIGDFFGGLFGGGEAEASAESAATSITSSFDVVPMQLEGSLGQIGPIATGAASEATAAFDGVGQSMTTTFDQIPTTFQTSMDTTLATAQSTADQLGTSFDSTGQQIQQALGAEAVAGIQEAWTGLQSFFTGMTEGMISSMTNVGTQLQTSFGAETVAQIQAAWTGLQAFFTTLASTISTSFAMVGTTIAMQLSMAVLTIQAQFVGLAAFCVGVAAMMVAAFMGVGMMIVASFAGVSAGVAAAFAGIVAFAVSSAAAIAAAYVSLGVQIVAPIQAAAAAIMTIWAGVVAFFISAWAQIAAAFRSGAAAAASAAASITSSLSGISGQLYGIVSAANSAASALSSMASAAASARAAAASAASAGGGGGLARGGFTHGPTLAGEDPGYPMEAVISFNPAYRAANIRYLQTAAKMLGVTDYAAEPANPGPWTRAIESDGPGLTANVSYETSVNIGDINFQPNITVSGNASQDDIAAAIREVFPEFKDLVAEAIAEGGVGDYGYNI